MSIAMGTADDLTARLIASDAACVGARLGVLAGRPGNPLDAALRHDGAITAFRCRVVPTASFNRVIGLSEADAPAVADYAAWLRAAGPGRRFEVAAGRHGPGLGRALTDAGFLPTAFAAAAVAPPADAEPATAVAIETVATPGEMELFLDTHLAGWGIDPAHRDAAKANMRGWIHLDGWTMLLARIDGIPAGTAVLHISGTTAYCADAATRPEWRGRGVQSALLHRRRRLAVAAGCDLVWVAGAFPSTSQANAARAGFQLAYNVAIWTDAR